MFYISAYLERNRSIYYERLLAISRDNDWNGWISFFLQAITEQADENSQKAKSILELYRDMKGVIPEGVIPEIIPSKHSIYVIDGIFSKPIFKSTYLVDITGNNKMAARRILRVLVDKEILKVIQEAKGRQPSAYAFSKLLEITERA